VRADVACGLKRSSLIGGRIYFESDAGRNFCCGRSKLLADMGSFDCVRLAPHFARDGNVWV